MAMADDDNVALRAGSDPHRRAPSSTRASSGQRNLSARLGTSIGEELRALAGVVLVFGVMTPLAQLGSALVWLGQRLERFGQVL